MAVKTTWEEVLEQLLESHVALRNAEEGLQSVRRTCVDPEMVGNLDQQINELEKMQDQLMGYIRRGIAAHRAMEVRWGKDLLAREPSVVQLQQMARRNGHSRVPAPLA